MSVRYRPIAHAWEAVYAADFTLDQVRRRTASLAEGLASKGLSCVIGYDTRFMGNLFARDVAAALQARGVRTLLAAAPTPLPALYHALDQQQGDCGLYVSARNRPYVYNGLVLLAADRGALSLDPLVDEMSPEGRPYAPGLFPPVGEPAAEQTGDLRAPYLEGLRAAVDLELIRRTSLTIFVDAMSGTTAGIIPALLGEGAQTRAIEINRDPDPLFGRISPSPVEAGLNRLKKLVRESDSHLGLAFSADGTALAVIDKSGEQIDPTELALLLGSYLSRQHRHKGPLIAPLPAAESPLASTRLAALEEANGIKFELTSSPQARIAELLEQERPSLLLGASADGEFSIGRIAAYPDALLAGLLVTEMVARSGGSLRSLIDAQREQLK